MNDTVSFIGLRRPFSPQAERLSRGANKTMKKAKQAVTADEPMGIVIAWGTVAQAEPRVRAYLWCDFESSVAERAENESHFVKA